MIKLRFFDRLPIAYINLQFAAGATSVGMKCLDPSRYLGLSEAAGVKNLAAVSSPLGL